MPSIYKFRSDIYAAGKAGEKTTRRLESVYADYPAELVTMATKAADRLMLNRVIENGAYIEEIQLLSGIHYSGYYWPQL